MCTVPTSLNTFPGAEQMLDDFFRWLKRGGLLIPTIPDRDSARGCITQITPCWVRVLYYKYRHLEHTDADFHETLKAASEVLSMPVFAERGEEQILHMAERIPGFLVGVSH